MLMASTMLVAACGGREPYSGPLASEANGVRRAALDWKCYPERQELWRRKVVRISACTGRIADTAVAVTRDVSSNAAMEVDRSWLVPPVTTAATYTKLQAETVARAGATTYRCESHGRFLVSIWQTPAYAQILQGETASGTMVLTSEIGTLSGC